MRLCCARVASYPGALSCARTEEMSPGTRLVLWEELGHEATLSLWNWGSLGEPLGGRVAHHIDNQVL